MYDSIKDSERKVVEDKRLSLKEKISKILGVLPEGYKEMEEGIIRPIKIPLLKMMLEASLEQFFQRDILIKNGYTYAEALDEVVEILIKGIMIQ